MGNILPAGTSTMCSAVGTTVTCVLQSDKEGGCVLWVMFRDLEDSYLFMLFLCPAPCSHVEGVSLKNYISRVSNYN